jgi:hypothetical protein
VSLNSILDSLDSKLISEAEWVFERMRDLGVSGGESYAYYQGRIDQLASIRAILASMEKEESK